MQRLWLTSGAVFLSGALLLTLELFVARALLPMVGGSAIAWTACVAFFQILLLGAALYAHLTARLGARRQALLHAILVLSALAMLPLHVTAPTLGPHDNTVLFMVRVLTASIGLPCFVLCATSSLVLQWLSLTPDKSPARTYAASNAGSLAGLVAYPFFIEPLIGLSGQAVAWTAGFALLAMLLCIIMLSVTRIDACALEEAPAVKPPSRGTPLLWFILSFVPCCLLLGVTTHMTNELPSFPLLWVVPLALYLMSLVAAFGTNSRRWLPGCLAVEPVLVGLMVILMFVPVRTSGFLVHLAAVFAASLTLHGRLAQVDPEADRGAFILWTCAGGAAAGIFNAAVAPLVFPCVAEFQLAVIAACLLRPPVPVKRSDPRAITKNFVYPALLAVVLLAVLLPLPRVGDSRDILSRTAILFVAAGIAVVFRKRPVRYGLGMAAVLAGGFWSFQWQATELMARSQYGVSRVVHDRSGKQMVLYHGTTIHGAQADSGALSREPGYYFRPDSPLGKLLASPPAQETGRSFAVVGLGAGSLAWYVQPSQLMRFYEIDPVVERIAREPRWFTYLSAAKGEVDVKLGDGRLALASEPDRLYDVIILDAFSSDSAPTHLLTMEAFQIYLRKLKPHGLLVFNTSNRHIDLARVVIAAARTLGLQVRATLPAQAFGTWAVVAADEHDFDGWLAGDVRWTAPKTAAMTAWTDDRTVILPVLKW